MYSAASLPVYPVAPKRTISRSFVGDIVEITDSNIVCWKVFVFSIILFVSEEPSYTVSHLDRLVSVQILAASTVLTKLMPRLSYTQHT